MPHESSWESMEEDWEDESSQLDPDEETSTIRCPECNAEIYEDSVQCAVCRCYISPGGNVWSGRPLWWVLLGLLGLVATTLALAGIGGF